MPPTHPLLFEANARQWTAALSESRQRDIDLYGVPDDVLDELSALGVTHLWLMGVWPTGPRARQQAMHIASLREAYATALPDWSDEDVVGSPFAIGALHVSPLLGGDGGLAALRARLAERDIAVVLDFVPNHLGLDHPWVAARPELFVQQRARFDGGFVQRDMSGERYIAHGKDPYFPGWTDTAQLDYRRRDTRVAMREQLLSLVDRCDGVRCDMAMLLLNDVFERTWASVPVAADTVRAQGDFWSDAIAAVRARAPTFMFLAEAYWDTERQLCEAGFDFAYDKTLYDLLAHQRGSDVQAHLMALREQNTRRAHFVENHDEPRIASLLSPEAYKAARLLTLGLPGMRFVHDGELEGRHTFARVQLGRRAQEPHVLDHAAWVKIVARTGVGRFAPEILQPRAAWHDNDTSRLFTIVQWTDPDDPWRFDLVVVNMGAHRAQCFAPVLLPERGAASEARLVLTDKLGNERYVRSAGELRREGLFLDVAGHAAQLFSFEREAAG